MNLTAVDQNFRVVTEFDRPDIAYHNCLSEPFRVHGLLLPKNPGDQFRRMDEEVAKKTSDGVFLLHANTAGGRITFQTDSLYVAINTTMNSIPRMPHFALSGIAGFDLYMNQDGTDRYQGTFMPPVDVTDGYASVIDFSDRQMREITINMPLYSNVQNVFIGLEKHATILPAKPYANQKPIVYYGSSITQGGCASRPGNTYQAIISRKYHYDYCNLGFSGNCKGEEIMVEYLSNLEMSLFVCDYDHNSPDPQHLEHTHERLYQRVREKHPNIPVILITRPQIYLNEQEKLRWAVVKKTYDNAVKQGDNNVHFLDGSKFFDDFAGDSATVDACHPNDLGFMCMAKKIGALIHQCEKKR